jgi:hypothetical protein
MGYLKKSPEKTHVANRPRDEDGKPLAGVHYLKPESLAPRFQKTSNLSINEADEDVLEEIRKRDAANA